MVIHNNKVPFYHARTHTDTQSMSEAIESSDVWTEKLNYSHRNGYIELESGQNALFLTKLNQINLRKT